MTARELRIGNIVSFSNHGDGSFEQSSIDLGDFNFFSYLENNFEKHYQPIPLTEDWLTRFGLYDNPQHTRITVPRNIKYVHQLQNLFFALTGEELVLKTT